MRQTTKYPNTNKVKSVIKDELGQGLVEYSIVLPIFLLCISLIFSYSNILLKKVSFDHALRDTILDLDFNDDQIEKIKKNMHPRGILMDRYSHGYLVNENLNRSKEIKIDEVVDEIKGLTLEQYLKEEIKKRNDFIDVERIEFVDFEEAGSDKNKESKIGLYSGLQHYHYRRNPAEDGRKYEETPVVSTNIIARLKVRYYIDTNNPILKSLYPEGIKHEKVFFTNSKAFRWRLPVVNPKEASELRSKTQI